MPVIDTIGLVPVDALTPYETPDEMRVVRIARSMVETGLLLDPVVIDTERGLLIDGHHRCAALGRLGLNRVPAFNVDYFSHSVEVRGWVRVSDAPASEVKRALSQASANKGDWRVVAIDDSEQIISEQRFTEALRAADFLQWLCLYVEAGGWRVRLEAPGARRGSSSAPSLRLSVVPVVGQTEVLDAARQGVRFPYEVNRHLVHGRLVALGAPLDQLRDGAIFADWLYARLGSPERIAVRPGRSWVNGRFYEESVVVPSDDNGLSGSA